MGLIQCYLVRHLLTTRKLLVFLLAPVQGPRWHRCPASGNTGRSLWPHLLMSFRLNSTRSRAGELALTFISV